MPKSAKRNNIKFAKSVIKKHVSGMAEKSWHEIYGMLTHSTTEQDTPKHHMLKHESMCIKELILLNKLIKILMVRVNTAPLSDSNLHYKGLHPRVKPGLSSLAAVFTSHFVAVHTGGCTALGHYCVYVSFS